jgi:hypothetical protein
MYNCIKCNKEFKFKSELERHKNKKKSCNKIIEYKCNNCNKEFLNMSNLKSHINKKNKCVKINLEDKIKELELEVKELKQNTNIHNNNIDNSNNIYINNSGNLNLNIFSTAGKIYYEYYNKSLNLDNLNINYETINNLILESCTDDLSNIFNFTKTIQEICFNMNLPENWIICHDELFNQLKLKINKDNIVNCKDNILSLLYTIAKQIVIIKCIDDDKLLFYNTFINKYENNEYNNHENINQFIKIFDNELKKYNSEILKIIHNKKYNNKQIEYIDELNNFENEDMSYITKNKLELEFLTIINKDEYKIFKNKNLKIDTYSYGIYDIIKINLFLYFIKLIYNNYLYPKNKTIKYDNNLFYYHINNNWIEIDNKELIIKIFKKIHKIFNNNIILENNIYYYNYINDFSDLKYGKNKVIVYDYIDIIIQYYKRKDSFNNHNNNII